LENERRPSKEKTRQERQSPSREKRGHEQHSRNRDGSSTKLYFSDRRGDIDIVKYGTLNRYDIPSYRRCGFGNVLGLPGQKIDREYSTEKKLYMVPLIRQRRKRLLTDRNTAKESKRDLRLVKVVDHKPDEHRDFIALSATGNHKRKRNSSDSSDGADGDETSGMDYRGFDDKREAEKPDDPDAYYESDTEIASAQSEVTRRNSELVRATRDTPQSLQAWLDLIDHQESMMKLDRATATLSTSDKRNLADVRITIYEEALKKIGDLETSQIELQRGLLLEAQQHWDGSKLAVKWQDALKKYPHNVALWFGYLDFVQSTFAIFKHEDCRTVVSRALEAVQSTNDSETTQARARLIVRVTSMIQQAGFQEFALAVWQAVLEFHLLASPDIQKADMLPHFEEFWDSEAPRIGEPDSKGWGYTASDTAAPPICGVTLGPDDEQTTTLEGFQLREVEFTNKLRYPGRTTDDIGEDDPFHTIFFSELKEYVTNTSTIPGELLVDAFLSFCGLPGLTNVSSSWTWDPFLQSESPRSHERIEMEGLVFQDALAQYLQAPFARFKMTSDLLAQQAFSLDASRLSPEFVRNALKLIVTKTPDHTYGELISEYLLAFESKHFPTEVVRTAKRMLKDRPSSLRLYNMYGLVESRRGNSAKADQVFSMALSMHSQTAAPSDRLELFRSWVWEALHRSDHVEALWRLVSPQGHVQARNNTDVQPDKNPIEKAFTTFREAIEAALLRKDHACAITSTSLLALLTYLHENNANAALEVHNNLVAWFASHKLSDSTHAEGNAQNVARFLAYHVSSASVVKPALLRTTLEPFITSFPGNTILLSTYAANEARFSIEDRVRGNMQRVLNVSPTSSVTTWAFAIHHETLKGEIAGSTSHSIRALYKRATESDASGAHCPALWMMYLRFELSQLQKEQDLRPNRRPRRDGKKNKWETRVDEAEDRVKDTFYQGLKLMPWCKDFIMYSFTAAKDVFSEEELWRLYRVMLEKELRLYTELDELRT
jgi:tetratricopeptide (TPR) repeat protein